MVAANGRTEINAPGGAEVVPEEVPASRTIAQRGIRTTADTADLMSALISDVLNDKVEPRKASVAVNATGKLLKAAELQLKYGAKDGPLTLARRADIDGEAETRAARKRELLAELERLG